MITKNIGKIGKLIIPKEVDRIIDILHSEIGATEWSGVLFFNITKGNIKNLKDLEFTAKFIYPMDIGSSAYTEHSYDESLMNAYDIYEEAIECEMSHVHSHHSMSCYFSTTDTSELEDNCKLHNYYLSLIVNFAKTYCAKVAIYSETENKSYHTFKGTDGKPLKVVTTSKEECMLVGDLDIILEGTTDKIEWLSGRIGDLKKKKEETKVVTYTPKDDFYKYDYSRGYQKKIWEENLDAEYDYLLKTQYKSSNKTSDVDKFLVNLILSSTGDTKDITLEAAINAMDKEFAGIVVGEESTTEDLYKEFLDANYEIIYSNIFNTDFNIRNNSITALAKLVELESKIKDSTTIEIVKDVISLYV